MEEFAADAVVEADAARDIAHIRTDDFAQIGDFVDEGDLGREEGVGGIFGEFRRAARGEQDRCLVEEQRAIDFTHDVARAFIFAADDDAVGALEVANRRAFAEEFGVGNDGDMLATRHFGDDALDLVTRADGNGRFGHDDTVVRQLLTNLLGGGIDIAEVGMAVTAPRRGANRDEDGVDAINALGKVGGEAEATGGDVGGDERFEAGFKDRHPPREQRVNLALILVNADDGMAEIGKAGSRHQADIACSDHGNLHRVSSLLRPSLVRAKPMPGGKANGAATCIAAPPNFIGPTNQAPVARERLSAG